MLSREFDEENGKRGGFYIFPAIFLCHIFR
jgi:hypothetical protein